MEQKKRKTTKSVGVAVGNSASAINYADNVVMRAKRGHGFAAEKANDLYDNMTGKNAKIVGGDNSKNGADRLVDGVQIQTKYCATGSKCVNDCFDAKGKLRYWNSDGTPMQIEVPSDKYEGAVKAFAKKITDGHVKGVRDPKRAIDIVRKGGFTYEQAKLIAKAGSIESLTYDGVKGIQLAGSAIGISAAVSFALSVWNGEALEVAIESACVAGLKVGGIAWVTSVLVAQVGKTGVEQGLRTTTDWVVKQVGAKATNWLVNGVRTGDSIYGAAATNSLSKLFRGNIVTAAITTVVLSSADVVRMFEGQISGAQLFKNVTNTAAGVAGGLTGWQAGAAAGASVGSAVPVIGTVVGGFLGALLGSFAGGAAAQSLSKGVMDGLIEDDANEMVRIVEEVIAEQAQLYLLNKAQLSALLTGLKSSDLDWPVLLRTMYAEIDRKAFARSFLPMKTVIEERKKIRLPTSAQVLKGVGKLVNKVANSK